MFITSNNEKELPDAFLRRCFFHYIRFPDKETMEKIVQVHYPNLKKSLLKEAMEVFFACHYRIDLRTGTALADSIAKPAGLHSDPELLPAQRLPAEKSL